MITLILPGEREILLPPRRKKMKRVFCFFLLACAVLGLGGCGGKEPAPYELNITEVPSGIIVREPIYDTDGRGITRIELVLSNETNRSCTLRYRVQWVDAKGFSVPTVVTTWDTTVVQARQTQRILSVAPSERAVKAFISFAYGE